MKFVINTAHQRFGGAVQVALSFIEECRHFSEHEYEVWVGPGVRRSLQPAEYPDNFLFRDFDFGPISLLKTRRISRSLQAAETAAEPNAVITTSGPSYFHSKAPQVIGFNLPLYIYPESPYLQGLSLKRRLRMAVKKQLHYYFFRRDAAAYVVQTDDVNQRVRDALHTDEVHTVTNTANAYYTDWKTFDPKLPPRENGRFRFVTISAYYPHKNLELIPEVSKELRRRGRNEVEFVLTLRPGDFAEHIGYGDEQIINIGPVRPAECPSLYAEVDALFLPTLAECFSASYPEAMTMEKPIVTTDLGFARSICGEAAHYYRAKDAKAAADAIEQLLDNSGLRNKLVSAGKRQLESFDTPRQRARKYLDLCERIALRR